MGPASIQEWLRWKMRVEATANILSALVVLFLSLAILAVMFVPGYLLGFFVTELLSEHWLRRPFPLSEIVKCSFGLMFLVLLFRGYIHDLHAEDAAQRPIFEYLPGEKTPLIFWREPRSILLGGAFRVADFEDILFTGPRWLRASFATLRKAGRQLRLDTKRCARILEVVAQRGHRVSFEELERFVPDANRFNVFEQLRDINGVVFLIQEPAGISLIEELRQELRRLQFGKMKSPPHFEKPPPPPPPPVEELTELERAFRLLGLKEKASLMEVKTAYRKKIKECHPDRFTRFGRDWQLLAEERSKQLNAAYETIMTERG